MAKTLVYSRGISRLLLEHKRVLTSVISIELGLLDELQRFQLLDSHQIHVIRRQTHAELQVSQLLSYVEKMSPELQRLFLSALHKTQQSHVIRYILCDGLRPTPDLSDDWPIYGTSSWAAIHNNWNQLLHILDSRNGLLLELFSLGFVSSYQIQRLHTLPTDHDKNESLLRYLKTSSVGHYKLFIDCLVKTKQHLAGSLLASHDTERFQPLNQRHASKINTKLETLCRLIDVKYKLTLEILVEIDCITLRQKDFIDSALTELESNKRLLNIISRGSQKDFFRFVTCLDLTEQEQTVRILLTDAAVVEIIAKTRGGSKLDRTIVAERMENLLRGTLSDIAEDFSSQAMDVIHAWCQRQGTEISSVQKQTDITLFILCYSLTEVLRLHDSYCCGQLRDFFQRIFYAVSCDKHLITVDELVWLTPI